MELGEFICSDGADVGVDEFDGVEVMEVMMQTVVRVKGWGAIGREMLFSMVVGAGFGYCEAVRF